jgi:hypothetical protein
MAPDREIRGSRWRSWYLGEELNPKRGAAAFQA